MHCSPYWTALTSYIVMSYRVQVSTLYVIFISSIQYTVFEVKIMTHSANFFLVQIRHSGFFDLLASLPYAVYVYDTSQVESRSSRSIVHVLTYPAKIRSTSAENAYVY